MLHLGERRPSVKRPLTLGKKLGYVSNDTLFPHFLWHALTQTSTNGEAMTDWAIWGTVARLHSREADLCFMVQEVGQYGSGAPQKPRVCALPNFVPLANPVGARAPPPSTLPSALGERSQRPVLYWNHMEVGRFRQRPPATSLFATCFPF